jgi:aminocarboxymuconate-semialdehyde decarboxylase
MKGNKPPVIDMHSHVLPRAMVEAIRQRPRDFGMTVRGTGTDEALVRDDNHGSPLFPEFHDVDAKIAGMDRKGIDISVLSVTPVVFFYWLDADKGLDAARVLNDGIAAMVASRPTRFRGMATLPMQAPELAVAEVRRAATLPGIRGVYLSTHVMDLNLDEPAFDPVYACCEELGLPIFLHPVNPVGAERMRKYHLRNLIGNPTDTAIAAASLIFGGVLDRFPKLDFVLPHAGGTLPVLAGRWDHGHKVRKELAHLPHPPSSYLRRFYYDTITHDAQTLVNLIRQVGADRVLMGSDCPADMSYTRPVDVVERLSQIDPAQREAILGLSARRLLKLD